MKKTFLNLITLCFIWLMIAISLLVPPQTIFAQSEELPSIVVSGNNGQILSQTNADQLANAGELTQIVTLYLVQKEMHQQNETLESIVPISDRAYHLSQDYNISNAPLRQDFEYTAADLFEAAWMKNAHGATLALVEWVAETEQNFIQLINQQLTDWGYEQAQIHSVTGLPEGYQLGESSTVKNNVLPAAALATATYHAIREFPEILDWTSQQEATLMPESEDPYPLENPNTMLDDSVYNRSQILGLKLGSASEDTYSLVTVADRDHYRLISVIMGSRSSSDLYEETGRLIDQTYASYTLEKVAKAGDSLDQVYRVPVLNGSPNQTVLTYADDFVAVVPIVDTAPQLTYQFEPDYEYFTLSRELIPPIDAGTQVGHLKVGIESQLEGVPEDMGAVPGALGNRARIITSEDVKPAAWYQSLWRFVSNGISRTWQGIRNFFVNAFN